MMKAAVHQEMSQHRKAHHYHQVCVGERYQVVHQLLLGWCVHYYA